MELIVGSFYHGDDEFGTECTKPGIPGYDYLSKIIKASGQYGTQFEIVLRPINQNELIPNESHCPTVYRNHDAK